MTVTHRDFIERFVTVTSTHSSMIVSPSRHTRSFAAAARNPFRSSSANPRLDRSRNRTRSLRSSGLPCAASGEASRKCDSFVDEKVSPVVKWMRPPYDSTIAFSRKMLALLSSTRFAYSGPLT